MISLVVGPPGAGKGLFLMRVVRDELLSSDRVIVTNFALKVPELAEFFKRRYPDADVDVFGRVVLLRDEEIRTFYLRLGDGPSWHIPEATDEDIRQERFQNYQRAIDEKWRGVCFIIDESDLVFGARDWQKFGKPCNYYHKQHRKLGHMVYHCCQAVEQMEKQIRMTCEQTIVMKNLTHRRMGIFRTPAAYLWSRYYKVPNPNSTSEQQGVFRLPLDGGLEDCYNTAAGVGMAGLAADKGQKPTGLSLVWLVVPAVVLIAAAFCFPQIMQWGVGKLTGSRPHPVQVSGGPSVPQDNRPLVARGVEGFTHAVARRLEGPGAVPAAGRLAEGGRPVVLAAHLPHVTGVLTWKGVQTVYLDDGTVFDSKTPGFQFAGKRGVLFNGKIYTFARPDSSAGESASWRYNEKPAALATAGIVRTVAGGR